MASTNQSPGYQKAEEKFLSAENDEERLVWLEEMIRECPKHKGAEKMLASLKTRYKKLKSKFETQKKAGKSSKKGIKKEDMQAVLVGFTNSGKSSLLKALTNANPKISLSKFTTQEPTIGTLKHGGVQIQLIDQASLKNQNFDIGIVNGTDLVIYVVNNIEEIEKIKDLLPKARGKELVVFNKIDSLNEKDKRKISATLSSKKYNFTLTSIYDQNSLENLKEKIIENFDMCRIYLKEPNKEASKRPLIVKPESTILDVARKISKDLAKNIKEIHIWGPSSKFPNQKVGLQHIVKDKDIVEFKTN